MASQTKILLKSCEIVWKIQEKYCQMVLIVKIPIFFGVRGRHSYVSDSSRRKGNLAHKIILRQLKDQIQMCNRSSYFPSNNIALTSKSQGRWFKPQEEQTIAKPL